MPRENILERTNEEVIERATGHFFRRASAEVGPIPASYNGKHICAVLVVTDVSLNENQMNSLETQIEAIAGVTKAHVLIGPARIPYDRLPAGTDLYIEADASFDIRPEPN